MRWLDWWSSKKDLKALAALERRRARIRTCSRIPPTTTAKKAALVAMQLSSDLDWSRAWFVATQILARVHLASPVADAVESLPTCFEQVGASIDDCYWNVRRSHKLKGGAKSKRDPQEGAADSVI